LPRLRVLNGKCQGQSFDLEPGVEHVVGHRQTASVTIDDPWVSWDHARILAEPGRPAWIEDLGSTNGTYVNCVRIKRQELHHEDIVFFGKTHVMFLESVRASGAGRAVQSDSGRVELREDPFASAASELAAPSWPGEPVGGHAVVSPLSGAPPRQASPFAETREDVRSESGHVRSLRLSDLQGDDDFELPVPSSQEISDLLGAPPPSAPRADGLMISKSTDALVPTSEMRTQELDVPESLGRRAPAEPHPSQQGAAPAALPRPVTRALGAPSGLGPPPSAQGPAPAPQEDAGADGWPLERARLIDTVRRQRMALDAVRQQSPAAVDAAARVLRDQELARLAERVAQLEAELAAARDLLADREAELDAVTDEMIAKEDEIDALRRQVSHSATADDLRSLEF